MLAKHSKVVRILSDSLKTLKGLGKPDDGIQDEIFADIPVVTSSVNV